MIKKKTGKTSLFFLVVIILFVLAATKIIVSNRLATFGQRLSQIDQEKIILKKEKSLLEGKIYQLSGLDNIYRRAEELGFVQTNSIVYFNREVPVALR